MKFILPAVVMFVMSVGVKQMCKTSKTDEEQISVIQFKEKTINPSLVQKEYVSLIENYSVMQ